uniref:Thiamin biosynthesis protein S n=1 Tax=Yamadaella caenomyce TaxID=259029 RepID=A0A1G4NZF3_9FLOR|nr:Thiamin biosynthesis protein S [Yamadaella caenomyce]SCW23889.1 Thiamin biosynthesis protein S [Yamadaella caenomyce]
MISNFYILINGEPFYCMQVMSVWQLLLYLNIDCNTNLIEYNNEILDYDRLKKVMVKPSDKIEIVTLVGGG